MSYARDRKLVKLAFVHMTSGRPFPPRSIGDRILEAGVDGVIDAVNRTHPPEDVDLVVGDVVVTQEPARWPRWLWLAFDKWTA